jgi:hypothetical protein
MKTKNLIAGAILAAAFSFAADANANGNHDNGRKLGHHKGQEHSHNNSSNAHGGNPVATSTSHGGNPVATSNAHGGQGGSAHAQGGQGGSAHAQGGSSTAHGGRASSESSSRSDSTSHSQGGNVGDINITEDHDYPTPIGIAPPVYVQANGECGEGWSLSIGAPYMAVGGGKATQNTFCLSQKAAIAAMNAGIVKDDNGLLASGVKALRVLHEEFDIAVNTVANNIIACGNVKPQSVILLTQDTPFCRLK